MMSLQLSLKLLFGDKPPSDTPTKRQLAELADSAKYDIDEAYKTMMVYFEHEKQEVYDNPCSRCAGQKRSYDVESVINSTFREIDCPRCRGTGVDPLPAI